MMKRVYRYMICAVIAVLIAYGNIMAGNNLVQRIVPEAIGTEKSVQTVPAAVLEGIERESAYLKNKILNSTNLLDSIVPEGTIYYISPNGNDSNPGKFEEGAWSSLIRVNETEFMPGDIVCFERGGVWRGQLRAREGVTYTAYGNGDKPKIYGSPENAASPEKWIKETENIYRYYKPLKSDVGTLVFNDGEEHAIKAILRTEADGKTFNNTTGEPFMNYRDLKHDLHFYHDYKGNGNVYLYSVKGNPGERFSGIELNVKGNIIQITGDGVTIDNLCIKYGGSHGVGSGTTKNLKVQYCELGWIGGSIQAEGIYGRNYPTRFGNAVEIWGGCENYTVDHCWIYQVYDAAVTQQFYIQENSNPVLMRNIRYSNNLMEYCNYGVEYFLGKMSGTSKIDDSNPTQSKDMIDNMVIERNIISHIGRGFSQQRPDKDQAAHIKSWNHHNPAKNCLIQDNVFEDSTDMIIHIASSFSGALPRMDGNLYLQKKGEELGIYGINPECKRIIYDEETADFIHGPGLGDKNAKVFFISSEE